MSKVSLLLSFWAFLIGASLAPTVTFAQSSQPSFPSCTNPSGTLKVHYDYGTHWIIGMSELQLGSDSVYRIEGNNYTQCYCPVDVVNTPGIQTNWLATDTLTQEQINDYISQGWIYVQNGQDFDLAPMPYLAQNNNFSCNPVQGGQNDQDGASSSNPSAPACTDSKPVAPNLVGAVRTSPTEAHLSWVKSSGALGYSIVYGTTPNNYQYGASNIGDVDTFTVTNLDPNQTYYFAVFGNNHCQPSDYSNEASLSNKIASGTGGQVLGVTTLAATGITNVLGSLVTLFSVCLVLVGLKLQKKF